MRMLSLLCLAAAASAALCLHATPAAASAPISWSTLTPTTLRALSPADVRAQATAAAMSSLPPAACAGFTAPLMSAVSNSTTYAGSACYGFTAQCIAFVQAAAYAGFSNDCVQFLPLPAAAQFNTTGVAQMSLDGVAGITMAELQSWTAQCGGFSQDQVASLGLSVPYSTCFGVTVACVQSMQPQSVLGLQGSCIRRWGNEVVAALSTQQLSFLGSSPTALPGLTAPQLAAVYTRYGLGWADSWFATAQNSLSSSATTGFVSLVDAGSLVAAERFTPTTDLSTKGRIQLALCDASCMAAVFANKNAPALLPAASWAGLRAVHVRSIGTTVGSSPQEPNAAVYGNIAWITDPKTFASWPSAAIYALTAAQLAGLTPGAFKNFPLAAINPDALPGFDVADMAQASESSFFGLPCGLYNRFSPAQAGTLHTLWPVIAAGLDTQCGGAGAGSSSSSSSTGAPAPNKSSSSTAPAPARSSSSSSSTGAAKPSSSSTAPAPSKSSSSSTAPAPAKPSSSSSSTGPAPRPSSSSTAPAPPRPSSSSSSSTGSPQPPAPSSSGAAPSGGPTGSTGLSSGAKAGIAIGVILAVIIFGAVLFWLYRKAQAQNDGLDQSLLNA